MSERPDPYQRLKELGLELPVPLPPVANFVPSVREGNLVFLSGQGPLEPGSGMKTGKVGADVSAEQAYEHARLAGLLLLGVLHREFGTLGRVTRVVKVLGMVNALPDFTMHPKVINGCSDLFVAVFGKSAGAHARSAVGVGSLPGNITVEIEAIVAIDG